MLRRSFLALGFVAGAIALLSFVTPQASADRLRYKKSVRILDGFNAKGKHDKPIEITTAKQFEKLFGKAALEKLGKQVDFTSEKIVWVTWMGSTTSYLTFDVLERSSPQKVSMWVELADPALADMRPHGKLVVMPKKAAWSFSGQQHHRLIPEMS